MPRNAEESGSQNIFLTPSGPDATLKFIGSAPQLGRPLTSLQQPVPVPAPAEEPPLAEDTGAGTSPDEAADPNAPVDIMAAFREDLGEDYRLPLIETVAGWQAGANGLDVQKLREDLLNSRMRREMRRFYAAEQRMPTAEEWEPRAEQLTQRTFTDIQRWAERARGLQRSRGPGGVQGMFLIDHDPTGRNLALRAWRDGAKTPGDSWVAKRANDIPVVLRPMLAPLLAGAMGTQMIVSDPNAPVGEESVYNDGQDILSFIGWANRALSPLTYIATASRAGGAGLEDPEDNPEGLTWRGLKAYLTSLDPRYVLAGWGSDENLLLLSRGEDNFTLSDEFQSQYAAPFMWLEMEAVEAIGEALGYDTTNLAESAAQGGAAFALSLVEPDPLFKAAGAGSKGVSAAVRPAGKLLGQTAELKAASRAATMLRLQDEALEAVATGGEDEMVAVVRRANEAMTHGESAAFNNLIVAALPRQSTLPAAVAGLAEESLKAREAAKKAFDEVVNIDLGALDEAITGAQKAATETATEAGTWQKAAKVAQEEVDVLPIPEAGGTLKDVPLGGPEVKIDPGMLEGNVATVRKTVTDAIEQQGYDVEELRALLASEMGGKARKGVLNMLETSYKQARLRRAVSAEKIAGVAEAATNKADEAAKKLAQAQGVRAQFQSAANDLVKDTIINQHIQATHRLMRRISSFGDAPTVRRLADEQVRSLVLKTAEAVSEQARLYEEMLRAPAEVADSATAAFEAAKRRVEGLVLATTKQDAARALEMQSALERASSVALQQTRQRLENVVEAAKSLGVEVELTGPLGDFAAAAGMAVESKGAVSVVKKLAGSIAKEQVERSAGLAVAQALGTLGSQYGRIANNAATMRGMGSLSLRKAAKAMEDVDLATSVVLGADARAHFTTPGLKKAMVWLENALRNVQDPARQLTGLSSLEVNNEFVTMLNRLQVGRRALIHTADPDKVPDQAERFLNVVRAMDNVGGQDAGTDADLFLRAAYGDDLVPDRSVMQAALPLLRMSARSDDMLQTFKGIDAIAWAFMPPNDYKGFAKLRKDVIGFLKDAPDDLTFEDLLKKVRDFTVQNKADYKKSATKYAAPPVDRELSRASLMAASAVLQTAELSRVMGRMRQIMGDMYTKQHWAAADSLLKGLTTEGPEFQKGLALLNELGVQPAMKAARKSEGDLNLSWVTLAEETDGTWAFVPRAFIEESTKSVGKIVKQNQPFATAEMDSVQGYVARTERQFWKLFNASLITGLILPRPGHFVNIFAGNIGQVWLDLGLGEALTFGKNTAVDLTALGLSSMKMEGLIPGGKRIDDALTAMTAKFGADKALPSPTAAFLSPVVSMVVDPAVGPAAKKLKGARAEATVGDLRRWAFEQRIVTSFAQSSGLARAMARDLDSTAWKKAKRLSGTFMRHYADVADTIEKRQRIALFSHLILERGMTPAQAGKATREALYDWNYPMTRVEANYLNRYLMFWGFQRRALGQAMQAILEPVSQQGTTWSELAQKTMMGSLGAEAMGVAPFKGTRVRDMERSMQAIEHTFAPKTLSVQQDLDGDGDVDAEDQALFKQQAVSAWWLSRPTGSRAGFTNLPMSPYTANEAMSWTGQEMRHYSYTLPSLTPLEMTNTIVGFAMALGQMVTGQEGAGQVALDYLAPMGGPVSEEVISAMAESAFGTRDFKGQSTNGVRVKKPTDRLVAQGIQHTAEMFGFKPEGGEGIVWPDSDQPGVIRMDPSYWPVYQAVLPVSYEAANYYDAFVQAGWEPTKARAATFFVTQLMGLPKAHMHAAEDTLGYDSRKLAEKVGRAVRQEEMAPLTGEPASPAEVQQTQQSRRDRMLGRDFPSHNIFLN